MKRSDTLTLVEGALCVALAAVLNSVFVWQMPNGGRVSLVMVPLVVYGLRRGWVWGLTAAAVFGLIDLLIEPAGILYPLQVVLDFPLAFGVAGLVAGLFRPAWRSVVARGAGPMAGVAVAATVAACAARFAAHWVSGVVFFAQFAEGQPVWLYSLLYNGSYMLPTAIASAAAVAVVMPALERLPRTASVEA